MGGQTQPSVTADVAGSASPRSPSRSPQRTTAFTSQAPEDENAKNSEEFPLDSRTNVIDLNAQPKDARIRKAQPKEARFREVQSRDAKPEDTKSRDAQTEVDELKKALKTANDEIDSLSKKLELTGLGYSRLQGESNNTIKDLKADLKISDKAISEVDRKYRTSVHQLTILQEEQRASETLGARLQVVLSEKKKLEQEVRAAKERMINREVELHAIMEAQLQGELREFEKSYDEHSRIVVQQHNKDIETAEWQHQEELKERERRHEEYCRIKEQQHSKAVKDVEICLKERIGDLETQKKDLEDKLRAQIAANHKLESKIVLAQEQVFKKVDESTFLGDSDPTIVSLFGSLTESIHFLAKVHSVSAWPRIQDTNAIKELEHALRDVVLSDDLGGKKIFPHELFMRTNKASVLCVSAALANMVCSRILEDPFWFLQDRGHLLEIYESLEKADLFQAQIWRSQLLRQVQKIEKAGVQNPLARYRRPATQMAAQDFLNSAPARYLLKPLAQNTNADVLNREVQHIFEAASDLSLRLGCHRAKVELWADVFMTGREFPFRFGSKYMQGHLYHKLNKDTYGDDKRLTRFDKRMPKILISPVVLASGDEDGQGYNENFRVWSKGIYWMDERN